MSANELCCAGGLFTSQIPSTDPVSSADFIFRREARPPSLSGLCGRRFSRLNPPASVASAHREIGCEISFRRIASPLVYMKPQLITACSRLVSKF